MGEVNLFHIKLKQKKVYKHLLKIIQYKDLINLKGSIALFQETVYGDPKY